VELKQIRYFISVATLRSFSRAAETLNVAQPALSRHVKMLEIELGTQLLFRTTRGVVPTEAGLTLLRMGESLLLYTKELREHVSRASDNPAGDIVIGMPQSISPSLAPLILMECQRVYPKLSIRITEGLSVFLAEWLRLGKIDLAVMTNLGEVSGLQSTHLAWEQMVLVADPKLVGRTRKDISVDKLEKLPLLLGAHFRPLIESALALRKIRLNVLMELDSVDIIKEMIVRQPYYSILPYASVHKEAQNRVLSVTTITEPHISRELVLAVNAQRPLAAGVNLARKLIIEKVKDLDLQPRGYRSSAAGRSSLKLSK
jgi:LysR family nitrogen assimilation transcriptional regulator